MLIISRHESPLALTALSPNAHFTSTINPHLGFLHDGSTMLGSAWMLSSQQTQMTHMSFIWLFGAWWRKIQICKHSIKSDWKYIPNAFHGGSVARERTSVWLTVGLGDRSSLTEHVQIFPFAIKFDQARQIADSWLPVASVPRSKGSSTRSHRYDVLRFFFFFWPEKSAESQNHALHGFINYW